jgi:hypothetical protein
MTEEPVFKKIEFLEPNCEPLGNPNNVKCNLCHECGRYVKIRVVK